MNMIKISCLGISGVLLALFLKQNRSSMAELLSLSVCLLIVYYSLLKLSSVFAMVNELSKYVLEQKMYFRILLKIIGITYIADFSSNICRDAGFGAVAGQVEIFGKISILAVSTPVLLALFETICSFV